MPRKELFDDWADEVRKELHDQDNRLVRLETTLKVLKAVLGFVTASGLTAMIWKLVLKITESGA